MSADPIHPWRYRRPGRSRPLLAALLALVGLLAVLGHLAFVLLLVLFSHVSLGPPREHKVPPRPVSLRTLTPQQWTKNRGPTSMRDSLAQRSQPQPSRPEEKKEEKKKKEINPKGQVVDVAPGNDQEDPNAKYLAEHSNKVQKESRSRDQTAFYRNAMPQRTTDTPRQGTGHDQVDKLQLSGNNGRANDDRPLREAGKNRPAFEVPDMKRRQEIALKQEPGPGVGPQVNNHPESAEVHGNANRLRIQRGEGTSGDDQASSDGKKGSPGVANLMPSSAVLDKITGAAANDHLGDVDEGEGTYLNTKEWKYASFFNRVKQSVGMHWDPGTPLRQRDPTGNMFAGRDRYTILSVTLNEKGMVKDIYVEKSCGLDFLDLEAIKSFERAQPFPNPPPGLIGNDATVHFQFGFYLDLGSGGRGLRLFRQGG